MADSEETLALRRRARRRLIGAIALVLALVIIPPWLMDLEPKPVVTNVTVEIPKQESAGLKPLAPPKPAPSALPKATESRSAVPSEESPKAAAQGETVARATPESARAKEDDAKRAEAILNSETYIVPLGAFSSKENVKQLEARLAKASVQHYTETVTTANGEQTRVRAGPFPTKEAAEQARGKLKSLGLSPGAVMARQ
jgi:DedD protein